MAELAITRKRANTRQRLVDAALEVFAREGFAGASIEMIAEAAGFTRGAFYSNFSSKDELFLELARQQIQARVDKAAQAVSDAGEHIFVSNSIDSGVVADIIGHVIGKSEAEREWFIIYSEFELFALRNPDTGRGVAKLSDVYLEQITQVIIPMIESLGVRLLGDPSVIARLLVIGYLDAAKRAFLTPDLPFDEALEQQVQWFTALVDRFVEPLATS